MNYNYDKTNLNPDLVTYIETTIFPQYDLNEAGHGITHILNVINKSLKISKNYDVNLNIVYTVASYHDIGHHINKDEHEKISADLMIKDKNLAKFFSDSELNIIKTAIEDHRASSNTSPRNIYGKIVSAADKNMTIEDAIIRTYMYTKRHHPDFNKQEVLEEIYNHIEDKFGINGYAKVYIKDEDFENLKKETIALLSNKENFYSKVNEIILKLK